jgi:TetR/AcrR family tetracycline transcriptional repressor
MADRVVRQAYDAGTAALAALPEDADWPARIEAQTSRLRESIKRHPGGAILLADSPKVLSDGALSVMERLLRTLADAGVPESQRIVGADALLSYVTGFVLQEQSESTTPAVDAAEFADLGERFPLTIAGASLHEPHEMFAQGIRLLCAGIEGLRRESASAGEQ